MKKILLALPLLLVGCYHATWADQPTTPSPTKTTAMEWNSNHKIGYSCQQQEVNPTLVWVSCDFQNFSSSVESACIRVHYTKNGQEVVESRQVCAYLAGNQSDTNFVAFNKDKRMTLDLKCGADLSLCQISTQSAENN